MIASAWLSRRSFRVHHTVLSISPTKTRSFLPRDALYCKALY